MHEHHVGTIAHQDRTQLDRTDTGFDERAFSRRWVPADKSPGRNVHNAVIEPFPAHDDTDSPRHWGSIRSAKRRRTRASAGGCIRVDIRI